MEATEDLDVEAALAALRNSRTELDGAVGVRGLLLALHRIAAERELTNQLLVRIAIPYRQKVERLNDEETRIRESLTTYLRTTKDGKVAIPDAGTAYLAKRPPKVEIEDEALLLRWWKDDAGREVPMKPAAPDLTEIKKQVIKELEDTGEVPPAGSGMSITPGEKQVTVRLT